VAFASLEQLAVPRAHHRAFLERAAASDDGNTSTGLAAFLTLRVLDHAGDAASPAAMEQQYDATRSFVDRLPPDPERRHLTTLLDAIGPDGSTAGAALHDALAGYATWLEGEMRLTEAMDVTDTHWWVSRDHGEAALLPVCLRRARLLRHQARFLEAQRTYDAADQLAELSDDSHAAQLSRIGRALVLQKTGNLPESARLLDEVIATARDAGDRDAEARARHDLAGTLHYMGRGAEAVPLAFRAWQLYDDTVARLRALSDVGQFLKELGYSSEARHALVVVLSHAPPLDVRTRAALELMEIHAIEGDRLAFERVRRDLDGVTPSLPVDERLDLALKTGLGLARFGRYDDAEAALETALALADTYGLGERLFAVEAALDQIRAGDRGTAPLASPSARVSSPELRGTIEDLEALAPTP
jgi:tetratricopeptide (TPR) repeat protein